MEHSLSPRFQNATIRAAGIDAVYVALRCGAGGAGERDALGQTGSAEGRSGGQSGGLAGLLRGIAAGGGAGNVTLPHKTAAAALVEVATAAVEKTGACNTFWAEGDRIHGDNTDVEGFAAAARSLIGSPAGARVLVVGAGGAARAAVLALIQARADAVHVLNRTPDRAQSLRDSLDPEGRRVTVMGGADALRREGFDLVVNATSLGLDPDDPAPLDLDAPVRVGAVLDLTYRGSGPGETALLAAAHTAGIPAADGHEMLLQQGAASFRRWFGREPDLDVMREAVAAG